MKISMNVKITRTQVIDNITRRFEAFTLDKFQMNEAAQIVLREIKANTRKGVGYDNKKHPKLTGETIARRKALAEVNSTSPFYKASKANATFMGDTVDGIVANVQGDKIILTGEGDHRPIIGVRGKPLAKSDAPIKDILRGLADLGYKILGVSDRAKKQITTLFIRYLRRKK